MHGTFLKVGLIRKYWQALQVACHTIWLFIAIATPDLICFYILTAAANEDSWSKALLCLPA